MKKKLLSIGLLLSFAAQASPVTGLFKLSGASMTQAATTAVEVVAKTAAEIAYEGQVAAAQELATQAAASQAEYAAKLTTEAYNAGMSLDQYQDLLRTPFVEKTGMFQTGWNSTKAVCAAVRDGATTFVEAHPTGTKVAAGVVAGTVAALAAYNYFKAPVQGCMTKKQFDNTVEGKALLTKENEAKKAKLAHDEMRNKANKLGLEAKQAKAAHKAMCMIANGSAANTTAVEVVAPVVTREVAPVVTREVAPVVNALDAEVARLQNHFRSYGLSLSEVNPANFAKYSKDAQVAVFGKVVA